MANDAFNLDARITTPGEAAGPQEPASISVVTRRVCTRSWATCRTTCTCACTSACTPGCPG